MTCLPSGYAKPELNNGYPIRQPVRTYHKCQLPYLLLSALKDSHINLTCFRQAPNLGRLYKE